MGRDVICKLALIALLIFVIWLGINSPYEPDGMVRNYRQETFRHKINVCAGTRLPFGICFDGISDVYYANEIHFGELGTVELSPERGLSAASSTENSSLDIYPPIEKVGWLWGRPLVMDSCFEGSCLLQIPLDWVKVEEGSFIVYLWER